MSTLSIRRLQLAGLPGRPLAEAELARVARSPQGGCAVVFVVKDLDLMEELRGIVAAEAVLARLAERIHAVQQLGGSLCRWSGSALLAVWEHAESSWDPARESEWVLDEWVSRVGASNDCDELGFSVTVEVEVFRVETRSTPGFRHSRLETGRLARQIDSFVALTAVGRRPAGSLAMGAAV